MQLVSPEEAARRARAVIAYAGLEINDVSERTGIKAGTLRNVVSKSRPQGGTIERLWAIADACGIPRWFMERGFEMEIHHIVPLTQGGTADPDNVALVDPQTHRILHSIEARLAELEAALRGRPEPDVTLTQSEVDARRQPPGDLGRDARGSTPTSPRLEPVGSPEAEDARRDTGEA